MKRLTRRDWTIIQALLMLGMLGMVLGAQLVPPAPHEANPLPYRPATAEEEHRWEVDRLAEELDRLR